MQDPGLVETISHLYDPNGTLYDCFAVDIDTLTSEPGWDNGSTGDAILFYISSLPVSAGALSFAGPFYYIGSIIGDSSDPPGGINTFNLDFEPLNGSRWFLQYRRIDPTGKTSALYQFDKYSETDSGP